MLRCVFVGSPNRFTELIVDWLSKHCNLTGVVWTYSAHWGKTNAGRVRFAKKRWRRFGILKTIDEALYYFVAKNILNPAGEVFQNRLCDGYEREHGLPDWRGETIRTNDINSTETVEFVRRGAPDVIMSMCINEFFRKEIRQIPRLGSFLWHEGIVPEYKGLYSPFWAIHNGEPELLGYTVLRMNERYDEGEIFLQGTVTGVNPRTDSAVYIGHKAILDSLPAVAHLFEELESGTARPLTIKGRKSCSYTYPGITAWLRYSMRIHELGKGIESEKEIARALPSKRLQDGP